MKKTIILIITSQGLEATIAGSDLPGPSSYQHKLHTSSFLDVDSYVREFYIGGEARRLRQILKINEDIKDGTIINWKAFEESLQDIYDNDLQVSPQDHPVCIVIPPWASQQSELSTFFFEKFNIPALFITDHATVILYASGRTTGLVVDFGETITYESAYYEGFHIPQSLMIQHYGGKDIDHYLSYLLRCRGIELVSAAAREITRAIKEKLCYVAHNPNEELKLAQENSKTSEIEKEHILPDGEKLKVSSERFLAPEIFFEPQNFTSEKLAVPEAIVQAVSQCDPDLQPILYQNIVIAGGSSMFPGLKERLHFELMKLLPSNVEVKIIAAPERKYSIWIGANILVSLKSMQKLWQLKDDPSVT